MPQAVERAVAYLSKVQLPNGSFQGSAGTSIIGFDPSITHSTVFFSALIICCLQSVPGTKEIRRKASRYLLRQRSADWSWNYWQRDSVSSKQHPYPDDMDDTFCALLALSLQDPMLINGEVMARVAKLLIGNESSVGGPYRTWLVTDPTSDWSNVDVAVNANIGAFLAQHDVSVPGLNAYLDTAIRHEALTSTYYLGTVPSLYFLSRWYHGPQSVALKKQIIDRLEDIDDRHCLQTAMLVSAARNIGLPASATQKARNRLRKALEDDHWLAQPLYIDPLVDGVQTYAGSAALTTAFALEALANIKPGTMATQPLKHARATHQVAITNAISESRQLPRSLGASYRRLVQKLAKGDTSGQITNMAGLTAAAYNRSLGDEVLNSLNQGSLNGWIAYSIYDDFLDGEGKTEVLSAAHYAHRRMLASFYSALPNHDFRSLVDETLTTIDAANLWEVTHARAKVEGNNLRGTVPSYKDMSQLAHRSWGHSLAARGVLLALDYSPASSQYKAVERFFHHYVIAKQLNDDAHDWKDDLSRGHISSVLSLLLERDGKHIDIQLAKTLPELQKQFWETTIPQVCELIFRHLRTAKEQINLADMRHPDIYLQWLMPLEESASQALRQSRDTRNFITAYGDQALQKKVSL